MMTTVFKLPEVSEGVESVDIAEITVALGDVIKSGAIICEVETDKAVAEIECPYAGTVKEILISAGDSVAIDTPLLVIEESAATNGADPVPSAAPTAVSEVSEPAQDPAEPSPEASADTRAPAEIKFCLQEVSEGVTAVDIAEVMVSTGDVIKSEAIICEVETDKAVAEIECPHPGTITAVHIASGDNVEVGAPLITIETTLGGAADRKVPAAPAASESTDPQPSDDVPEAPTSEISPKSSVPVNDGQPPPPAGPATRRLARKLGVDLAQVTGTARGGRITIEDVEGFVRVKLTEPAAGAASLSPGMIQATAFTGLQPVRTCRMGTTQQNLSLGCQ